MESAERNLDATTSSMDIVALNNLVVSMRPLVRKVKVQVIRKLVGQIKKYRNKKGTDEQKSKNNNKADRIHQEICALKELKEDRVAKSSLANTITMQQVANMNNTTVKVLTRMATHSLLQSHVDQWRKQHDDWKELAAFMLSKNTGRRYKKKNKAKREAGEESDEQDDETDTKTQKTKVALEVEANLAIKSKTQSNILVKKDSKKMVDKCNVDSNKKKGKSKAPDMENEISYDVLMRLAMGMESEPRESVDSGKKESEMRNSESESVSENETGSESESKTESESESKPQSENETESENESKTEPESERRPQSESERETNKPKVSKKCKMEAKADNRLNKSVISAKIPTTTVNKDGVIEMFNLENLAEDVTDIPVTSKKDVSSSVENLETKVKAKRDGFFFRGSGDEEDDDDDDDEEDGFPPSEEEEKSAGQFKKYSKGFEKPNRFPTKKYDAYNRDKYEKYPKKKFDSYPRKNKPDAYQKQSKTDAYQHQSKPTLYKKQDGTAETLHPSWEASRKRKQQQTSIKSFEGKKIKFDD